jgi:hypothetical protein
MTNVRKLKQELPAIRRPAPPASLFESPYLTFAPAPDLLEWARITFILDGAPLRNEDHQHTEFADLQFLWASGGFAKQGRTVLGQCEEVTFRAGPWQKGRQEQQMRDWFGSVPAFVITLDAAYSLKCSDEEFCALVEHELYHIGHTMDEFGAPAFTKDGLPKLSMRAHDVEEFVGVVRRYGASADVQKMIDAAKTTPEVAKLNIARACGTCLLRAA